MKKWLLILLLCPFVAKSQIVADTAVYIGKEGDTVKIVNYRNAATSITPTTTRLRDSIAVVRGLIDLKQNILGFTPYNATNPNGYISGITSGNVTTALGYTPINPATFVAGTNYLAPNGNGSALTNMTTSQLTASTNKNFVTDAQATIIGNTSSGTYTPVLTNVSNIAASTAYVCQWVRIGNTVVVSGQVDVDCTLAASTFSELGLSLPIASNLTAATQVGGTAITDAVANLSARVKGDATNDRASLSFRAISLTNDTYSFTFTYLVQ